MTRAHRLPQILLRLKQTYPDAHCELNYRNPFELLVATILSAQCTDVRVNQVTPELFRHYPTAQAMACADPHHLQTLIRPTGFYRNKAKSLLGMARAIVTHHQGQVPSTLDALQALPGVGRKTANVVLGEAFHSPQGIVVDTHVARLARRLGLTRQTEPLKIEHSLLPLVPRSDWALFSHLLIWHGRRRCKARRPHCATCEISDLCPSGLRLTVS